MARRVSSSTFVGRQAELRALVAAFDQVENGGHRAILVEGEAGIGKSRLLDRFLADAVERGALVLRGGCLPLAETVPYGPFMGWIGDLPGIDGEATPSDRGGFLRSVSNGLVRLSETEPVVVVVEDLHWADESTIDLLVMLARGVGEAPMLLVATRRSDEVATTSHLAGAVTELERSGHMERLVLAPFGVDEVRQQVTGILGIEPPPGAVDRLVERTDGNPFFIEELVAAGDGEELPATVREVVLARVAHLAPETRRVLRVGAAVGRSAGHALIATIAGLDEEALGGALREAINHRLLVVDWPDGYAFRHALVQEAVYGEVLPGERRALHEQIASALEVHPELAMGTEAASGVAELAHHWQVAGRDTEAFTASVAAAEAAGAAYAPSEAHTQYERALELWPRVTDAEGRAGTSRSALLEAAAEAASSAGRNDRAQALIRMALDDIGAAADDARRPALLERLGRYAWVGGDLTAAQRAYEEALEVMPSGSSEIGARVLAATAQRLMLDNRLVESAPYAERAIAMAGEAGVRTVEGHARCTLGVVRGFLGRVEEGEELGRSALAIALDSGGGDDIARAYVNLTETLIVGRRAGAAVPLAEEGVATLRRLGMMRNHGLAVAGNLVWGLSAVGRWEEAERLGAELLGIDAEPWGRVQSLPAVAELHLRTGSFDRALRHLDELRDLVGGAQEFQYRARERIHRAELACWRGDWEMARSAVDEGIAITREVGVPSWTLTLCALGARAEADAVAEDRLTGRRPAVDRAEAAADGYLGQAEETIAWVETVGGHGDAFLHDVALVRAERSRLAQPADPDPWSAVAADAGDDLFRGAYARWRESESLLAAQGKRARAEDALREAHRLATDLRAAPMLAEIEALARRARIDLGPVDSEPDVAGVEAADSAVADRLGLTPRELEVLGLVGEGLSNGEIGAALFISTKTASVHVSNILRKLDLTSRVQAAAVAHRAGLVSAEGVVLPPGAP